MRKFAIGLIVVFLVTSFVSVSRASSALLAPEAETRINNGSMESVRAYEGVRASLESERNKNLLAQAGGDYGLSKTADSAGLRNIGSDDLAVRIGQVISAALGFIGVVFLIITIYGGFLWMTSGGSSERAKQGGSFIKNGAIGIIIILSAYAITTFVIDLVAGEPEPVSSTTQTTLPSSNTSPTGDPCANIPYGDYCPCDPARPGECSSGICAEDLVNPGNYVCTP